MYELLTGEHAYNESNIHAFFRAMEEREIQLPSTYDSSIPFEVDRLCLKVIAKEKKDRYQSLEEFSENLKECIKLTKKYTKNEEQVLKSRGRSLQISDQKEKRREEKEVGTVVYEKTETGVSSIDAVKERGLSIWNRYCDTLQSQYTISSPIKWGMIGAIGLVIGYVGLNLLSDMAEKSVTNVSSQIQLKDAIEYVDTGKASKKEYEQALEFLRQYVLKGDSQAYVYLGKIHEKGLGTEVDYAKALAYYTKALVNGKKKVKKDIAKLYLQGGKGLKKDYSLAKKYLEQLVSEGDRSALKKLGELYQYGGFGVEKSIKNAFEWYIKALVKGDRSAVENIETLYDEKDFSELEKDWNKAYGVAYNIANFYVHGKMSIKPDYNKAIEWYKQAGKEGDVKAFVKIAELYERGDEKVTQDTMKPLEWYERALESGEKSGTQRLVEIYIKNNNEIKDRQRKVVEICKNESQYIDSKTLMLVGHMCKMGTKGFTQNYKQAVELYEKAVKRGEKSVLQEISDLYFEGGYGLEKNGDKGYEFMDKAALELKIDSSHLIAKAYKEGNEKVKKDYTKALEWCLKGVVRNNREALLLGAMIHYKNSLVSKKDVTELIRWFENAAQYKNSNAMYHLACIYEEGRGVEKCERKPFKWYLEAMRLGNTHAMRNLAHIYEEGRGVDIDYKRMFEWYLKAANLEDGVAMRQVSYLYQQGKGVERNRFYRIEWESKAIDHIDKTSKEIIRLCEEKIDLGSKSAIMTLASIYAGTYRNIKITDHDYNKAAELYKKGVELGNTVAMVELGKLYYSGKVSVERKEFESRWGRDLRRRKIGISWYEKAANNNNVEAMCFLGNYHSLYKTWKPKNYKKSLEWYQKAAMLQSTQAMFQLGNIYYHGYGVKKSSTKAKEWYIKSATTGNKDAMLKLGKMYQYGLGVRKNLDEANKWYKMSRKN